MQLQFIDQTKKTKKTQGMMIPEFDDQLTCWRNWLGSADAA